MKVRLQTRSASDPKTVVGTLTCIIRNEGILGFYSGLSAALLRQLTYSTVRFGVYEHLKARFTPRSDSQDPIGQSSMAGLIVMSSTSGFLGGIAGNPADVLNVRMQSDKAARAESRRNYKNALDGLIRMTREEGITSLFRGVGAHSTRAILMTSSQLASYDGSKQYCLSRLAMKETFLTHVAVSLAASLIATTVCSPVDVIITRIMREEGRCLCSCSLEGRTRKRASYGCSEAGSPVLRGWDHRLSARLCFSSIIKRCIGGGRSVNTYRIKVVF